MIYKLISHSDSFKEQESKNLLDLMIIAEELSESKVIKWSTQYKSIKRIIGYNERNEYFSIKEEK